MTYKPYPIPTTFTNPFSSIERTEARPGRINLVVPNETISTLMRIQPRPPGIVTTTLNILYVKFLNEIRLRGLDDPARVDEYIEFVLRCTLNYFPSTQPNRRGNVPNGSFAGTMPEAETSNVAGGTEGSDSASPGASSQSGRVQSTSRAKGRRERRAATVPEGGSV